MEIAERINRNASLLSEISAEEKNTLQGTSELPSIDSISHIVDLAKQIIFPGYFENDTFDANTRYYHIGVYLDKLYRELKKQVRLCFKTFKQKDLTEKEIDETVLGFVDFIPEIKRLLYTDVDAMFRTDPAATALGEIIFCYPFVQTMIHYRIAHKLHELGVPVLPRIMTEMAHSKTGIDIHPGAKIDEYFCIDHGTGVVIGGTCIIGSHVTLYQGVTLGAKHFTYDENGTPQDTPRHPIIENNVTVYSNATILGRITIGHDTIIGGNIWITESVPPHSKIIQRKAVPIEFLDGAGI